MSRRMESVSPAGVLKQRIPLEVLFGNPDRALPKVSPDGKRLSFVAPCDGVLNLWVGDIEGDHAYPVTGDQGRGIGGNYLYGECPYEWAQNDRHLLYLQDRDGDGNTHLYRVDVQSGETVDLTPFEGVQAQLLATSARFPDHVLIALNRDDPIRHDVYRATLSSGALEKIADNVGFMSVAGLGGWLIDHHFRVRGAVRATVDGGAEVLLRASETDALEPVIRFGIEDSLTSRPLDFTADGRSLFLIDSRGNCTGRLVRFDLAAGRTAQVLVEDPRYDVSGEHAPVIFHPQTGEPQLVPVIGARHSYVVLDQSIADDMARITALHSGDVALVSRDRADRLWVLSFTADDGPFAYFLYDRQSREGRHLFDSKPELRDYPLGQMEPFEYRARDGLRIEGYLTFPPGEARKNLPAVVVPHGGPYERDEWGFNPRVQFLATRGYLVIKPNYRGSLGYGKAHLNAGNKEWGGAMHDDLVDAVAHVVERGYADRERIGIMGGSYGGYAALAGAAFTPELFRCAVDFYGPSSLITMTESLPPWFEPLRALFAHRVGDPRTERDFLWSRSPLSAVDRIRCPVFIAQGANDPGVPPEHSDRIVAALRERGIPHEYLLFSDEGHGFVRPDNNVELHRRVETFLAEHLGSQA